MSLLEKMLSKDMSEAEYKNARRRTTAANKKRREQQKSSNAHTVVDKAFIDSIVTIFKK